MGMREFPPIRKTAAPEPPQIPWQIEESKLPGLPRALEPPYAFGIEVFGSIHMAAQGFAHDERPEDIGRAFADAIHFRIADQLLDAERRFASLPFRFGGFIAHAPEDDLGIPDKTDRVFGTEDLRDRRFDPDIVAMLIGQMPDQHGQPFHRKQMAGHVSDANLLRFAFRQSLLECPALVRPIQRRLPRLFRHAEADGRDTDSAPHV